MTSAMAQSLRHHFRPLPQDATRSWSDGISIYMIGAGCGRHLRGRENILKRLVVHSGAANLGLLMRNLFGTD